MRKKLILTLKGDAEPPVTTERIDDSSNGFEIFVNENPNVGTFQVLIEQDGKWLELATFYVG